MEVVDGAAVRVRGVGGAANHAGARFTRRTRETHGVARLGPRASGHARRSSGHRDGGRTCGVPGVFVGARLRIVLSTSRRVDGVLPAARRGGQGAERVVGFPPGGVSASCADVSSNNLDANHATQDRSNQLAYSVRASTSNPSNVMTYVHDGASTTQLRLGGFGAEERLLFIRVIRA